MANKYIINVDVWDSNSQTTEIISVHLIEDLLMDYDTADRYLYNKKSFSTEELFNISEDINDIAESKLL